MWTQDRAAPGVYDPSVQAKYKYNYCIFLIRGEEIMNKLKTIKITGFHLARKWDKSSNGLAFGSFSKEIVKIAISFPNLKLKMSLAINSLIKGAISNTTPMGNRVYLHPNHHKGCCQLSKFFFNKGLMK